MTLSEAYDLPIPVFYKMEVGFRDFINQSRIGDGNTVEVLKRRYIDPAELAKLDVIAIRDEINRVRSMVRAQYKLEIRDRDSITEDGKKLWVCQGKRVIGSRGCSRSERQVNLEIHHMHPFTFVELFRKFGGRDGVLQWHSERANLKHLVTLCEDCHDLIHELRDDKDEVA